MARSLTGRILDPGSGIVYTLSLSELDETAPARMSYYGLVNKTRIAFRQGPRTRTAVL